MKIGDSITWANCGQALLIWLHVPITDPTIEMIFGLAVEAAVTYLENRDFQTVTPANTWVPGVGEFVPEPVTTVDLPVPVKVKFGIFEYARAARNHLNRGGGEALGLTGGSAAGVSETYTAAAASSMHLVGMQAAIPFWFPYKMPSRAGAAG